MSADAAKTSLPQARWLVGLLRFFTIVFDGYDLVGHGSMLPTVAHLRRMKIPYVTLDLVAPL